MKLKITFGSRVFFTAVVSLFVAVAALGAVPTNHGGCTNANNPGLCTDHVGTLYTAAAAKNACLRANGNFLSQGCPATARIGSCAAGRPETKIIYRYDSNYEGGVGAARKACNAVRGLFSAP